tara:strand:+ start:1384 stop:6360 length:4977 start_codon:yes stop_codon:yes gene_type:complete
MAIAFNVEPYWDDFEDVASGNTLSPKEQYQRILFRPGKAVQARELTQLQTSLQHQISATGDHLFKDGSVVVPGAVHLHNKIDFVKLSACNTAAVVDIVGTEYSDGTNVAKVIHAALASGSDPITLWVQYISGGVFAAEASLTATGSKTATVSAAADTPTGFGSIVSIEDGIYYIKKHFVTAKANTIVLAKYTSNVSFDIGLLVTEALISSGTDTSLNDNATGTPNESAPGAHRYSVTAALSTQAVNANSGNFVLIARLEAGVITKNARTTDYNHLADELARRTFDESGNYYVNPFKALVKAHASDSTKLTLGVEPSKAYVRGYEIETLITTNVHFDKARTSEVVSDKLTEVIHNNYIEVDNMVGTPDITTYGKISIENTGGTEIGTCRARSIERVSGNGASTASRFRIHIFDFTGTMTDATQLDDKEGTAAGTAFSAQIAQTNSVNVFNIGPDSLIYELPYKRIKTLNGEVDENNPVAYDFSYNTNRLLTAAAVSGGGAVTFTAAASGEQFGSKAANTNWILINDTDSTVGGEEVLVGDITIDNNATPPSVVIANLPGSASGDTCRLIAPMVRTLTHKTKTLSGNTAVAFNAATDFTGTGQALGHADVHELVTVVETSGSVDVTEHFDLDNGQRDDYYNVGRIKLKTTSNYAAAVALTVTYKYFSHSTGDFFSVDSYTGQIDYDAIPKIGDIELRSAVDFRPRVGDAGGNFTGSGNSTSFAPTRYSQFSTDIQYYLPRIDKVYLDSKGVFGVAPGVPATYPEATGIPKDAMHLYTLTIPAYTLTTAEVDVDYIDNRRYTMRDIGVIDKRISQIEYYSVLSFLEAEAQNKQILDGSNNPRWKSGYLVDAFSNTRMSNSASPEYKASVDIAKRVLRPPFAQGNAAFAYHDSSTTTKTGDLVTLPYTSAAIISQTQYSGQINVNPYDVFNWTGSLALTPTTDEWRDIDRRPEVVINNDGEFDAMVAALQPQVGTVWGEWSTNWSGSSSWQGVGGNTQALIQTGTRTRTGVQQTIEVQTSRFSTGDRIVEVNFVPFMRTRLVAFSATRMKPATQVYAFFDGTSVADYVSTNASSYDPLVGINTVTSHPATATTLTTDANGAVSGTFLVPNNSTLNFPTGEKEFKLTQSSVNNDEVTTTSSTAMYTAAGLIETRENVIISTRTPVIQRNAVSDSTGDSRTLQTRQIQTNWEDPLAQSILLDQSAFITSIDLYFTAKDAAIPVQIQIRKMVNGFPTQEVVPFADVTLNPGSVNADGTATSFTFASPVFLQNGIEYAIVVLANSNNYTVHYAEIGKEDQNGNRISQQPYNGVLFKSQNASTWTADQNKDLRFVINRAVFDISTSRTCVLRNAALPSRALVSNPITTTNASTNITVAHRDHGMKVGDTVTLAGLAATLNGHTTTHLNTTHTITAITRDGYTFVSSGTGDATGIGGGTAVQATQHLAWNTLHPIIQQVVLPDTTQTWTVQDSLESSGTITATAVAITANEDYTPLYPKVIKSGATHTLQLNGTFTSTSNYLSPVIDLERCSAITISNRIDNVTSGETAATGGDNLAKYITKTIELNDTSDTIKIYLDVNRPNGTFVDVYHKTGNTAGTFDEELWVEATPTGNNGIVAYSDGTTYDETVYDITPAAAFTIFAVKIVMRSTGTSYIPKCQDLRAIALRV